MAEKTGEREGSKVTFSGPRSARRTSNGKVDRKSGMKVMISHALDQIAIDVEQAMEIYGQELARTGPVGD